MKDERKVITIIKAKGEPDKVKVERQGFNEGEPKVVAAEEAMPELRPKKEKKEKSLGFMPPEESRAKKRKGLKLKGLKG